jgi:hypothetical protein
MTSRTRSVRARRVEVPDEIRALDTLLSRDYAAAWAAEVTDGEGCSAERWARATFEDAPHALRAFIVAGWTSFLGLRLGPRDSPDHVLGWRIVTDAPELIILESQFRFGTAHNLVRVDDSRVLLATFVRYEKRGGRTAWSVAAPLHHRIVPYLLGRAASGFAAAASA